MGTADPGEYIVTTYLDPQNGRSYLVQGKLAIKTINENDFLCLTEVLRQEDDGSAQPFEDIVIDRAIGEYAQAILASP